jgi:hypothetical protein
MRLLLLSVSALAALTSALPAASPDPPSKNGPTLTAQLELCDGPQFSGKCDMFLIEKCYDLWNNTEYDIANYLNDKVRSARKGPNTDCKLYDYPGCTGPYLDVAPNGMWDLATDVYNQASNEMWDKKVSAFRCWVTA